MMGYPGEFPYIDGTTVTNGGVYAFDGTQNEFINVVDLKIEAAGTEGAVDVEVAPSWRVVNNELTMMSAGANGLECNAGAIGGTGSAQYWVGNHIHDTNGTSADQTHGIYVNNNAGTYEIAYNWIEVINNGTGIQLDGPQGASPTTITAGAHIHHNIIHDTLKYGIELGNYGATSGNMTDEVVSVNLVYNTKGPGLIFNTITNTAPLHALIFNNTFYNVATAGGAGAIDNDNGSMLAGMAITFSNNIVVPHTGEAYFSELSGSTGLANVAGTSNLFANGTGGTLGTSPRAQTPSFTSPPSSPVASGLALPNMTLAAGSPGAGEASTTMFTGNGIADMPYFPAFDGVTTDLNSLAFSTTAPDIGAVQ
jgi:hypothetical protein